MLIDEADVELIAGHGGPGKVSFYQPPQKGPDGGNGGKGADIYLRSSDSVSSLGYFAKHTKVNAANGQSGQSNRKFGKDGLNLYIDVPVHTIVLDLDSGESFTLPKPGMELLICKGGKGGRGNYEFRSSRNTTPEYAQPGLNGQLRKVKIHIKLIADIGLIGLPNSGKSSLLNELTAANAKVGNYAFTTLEPNLGVLNLNGRKIIADIPGIIEGASEGKGLGIKFLKHIEKVRVLLHCIPCDSLDPIKEYHTVRKELVAYNPQLSRKREVILLTKSDLVDNNGLEELKKELSGLKKPVIAVSIYNFESLEELKKYL